MVELAELAELELVGVRVDESVEEEAAILGVRGARVNGREASVGLRGVSLS